MSDKRTEDIIKNVSETIIRVAQATAMQTSHIYDENATSKIEKNGGIDVIKKNFNSLLENLYLPTKEFEIQVFLKKVENYLAENQRLLYSEFTNIIISCNVKNDQKVGIIISNLENCIEYSINENNNVSENIKKTLIKLWDHANLASNQYNYFMTTDDAFIAKVKPIIDPKIADLKNEVTKAEEKLEKSSKKIKKMKSKLMSEIISMISIFVGIAFVMFGGMTLLNNLFDFTGMDHVPLTELLCIGSLLGIIVIAIIYAFVVFILKLIEKETRPVSLLNGIIYVVLGILIFICCGTFYIWSTNLNNDLQNSQETPIINKTDVKTQPEQENR